MVSGVYLALYRGRKSGYKPSALLARFSDWLTRKLTKGQYSHCEIVVARREFIRGGHYESEMVYDCYSSSVRDGGVRCKRINVTDGKWDLLPLNISETQVKTLFVKTEGRKYDWLGAVGVVLKSSHSSSKYFCSEWCGKVLGLNEPWRFSPNDLAVIVQVINK